ncbi:MAG: putative lipid II flippase FtsW [Gammaproteobacteria bacterium]|nr:putative lipid II flippase FtsW [Gammaproteobacteria bacterium]
MGAFAAILTLGLVMVASASIALADRQTGQPLYYLWRQLGYTAAGVLLMALTVRIPLARWRAHGPLLLFASVVLLGLVLVPGVGREVNGSYRWIPLGPINMQPSELAKLFMILFLAGYLVRRGHEVRTRFSGFAKPMALLVGISGLLLMEPDYGATAVLFATTLGMLFLGGVPLVLFLGWVAAGLGVMVAMVLLAPYRLQRLTTFMDPWVDPFNTGFQLTQALIAVGRGQWLGVGLGGSVQKLFYLPEAHTDFLVAVLAEELGLLGLLVVVGLFAFVVLRAFQLARQAEDREDPFAAYVGYGIGLSLALQALVNVGVNLGALPTKGLTLPLMSYGGSSMLVNCLAGGLLLRLAQEQRLGGAR